jgi:hypothetical protein
MKPSGRIRSFSRPKCRNHHLYPVGKLMRKFPDFYGEHFCNLFLPWELKDFPQLEYWNNGILEGWDERKKNNKGIISNFDTHYSNTPTFHHSVWMA